MHVPIARADVCNADWHFVHNSPLLKSRIAIIVRPLAFLLICLIVAACGHRGPLYLPGKPGDPAFDRQNRESRSSPAGPGQSPSIGNATRADESQR